MMGAQKSIPTQGPQVEHRRPRHLAQDVPSAENPEAEEGHEEGADDEDHGLDGRGVGHRPHPAEDGVDAGQHHNQDGADPEAVEAHEVDVGNEHREDDAPCEDADCQLGEDVGHERDARQHGPVDG
jgi:hypothetical protein